VAKILWFSDSMLVPSGFGGQTKIVCEGLAAKGHEVTVICSPGPMHRGPLPENLREWRFQNVNDVKMIERVARQVQPDVTVFFWCMIVEAMMMQAPFLMANCPVLVWLPWEGSTLPAEARSMFGEVPADRLVHLTHFGKRLWNPITKSKRVIPHAVPVDEFAGPVEPGARAEEKQALRRAWSRRLKFPLYDDTLVILNVDRNTYHKRWDATMAYTAGLKEKVERDVVLIAHTRRGDSPDDKTDDMSVNIPEMEKRYGVAGKVCYTEFDWDKGFTRTDLGELFRLADFRLSTSQGEGFGIPCIEAMAAGTPQILPRSTTMPELFAEEGPAAMGREEAVDCPWLVDPAFFESRLFGALWAVPDVNAMVKRTVKLLDNPERMERQLARDIVRVEDFAVPGVVDGWHTVIEEEVTRDKDKLWYQYRQGWGNRAREQRSLVAAAVVLGKLAGARPVVDIGAFKGEFVEICLERNVNIQGIEYDVKASEHCTDRAGCFVSCGTFRDTIFPSATVAVVTDAWGLFARDEVLEHVVGQLASYPWLMLRFEQLARWDAVFRDVAGVVAALEERGMMRRHDLERMAREGIEEHFTHEIWMAGNDTSRLPEGFLDKNDAESICNQ